MKIRLAEETDIDQLIQMRWDFTFEDKEYQVTDGVKLEFFKSECRDFLASAVNSDLWFIWVAEVEEKIVAHIYIEIIQKVPRPGRITNPFAFMTNVYTIKDFRNKGIGSKLITVINQWAKGRKYEFIIVWPSDDSIDYYKRNGYVHCDEPMEFFPSDLG